MATGSGVGTGDEAPARGLVTLAVMVAQSEPSGGHTSHPVPVGILTFGVVSAVLVVVVVLVVLQLTGASTQAHGPNYVAPASAALVQEVTTVPASAFDSVGDPSAPLLYAPTVLSSRPTLSIRGRPAVVWVGALYCPTCAAERWALVIALGRFGTFDKLFTTASAGSEVFADTPTFSFDGSVYTSSTVALSAVEEYGNQSSAYAPAGFEKLQSPDALQSSAMRSYDVAPYAQPGLLPFIDVADKMIVSGSSFSPGVLSGLSMQQIASDTREPDEPDRRGPPRSGEPDHSGDLRRDRRPAGRRLSARPRSSPRPRTSDSVADREPWLSTLRCDRQPTRSLSCLRSTSLRPPQMPCGSLIRIAYSRQAPLTVQLAHISFARASRSALSSLRSAWVGGKKTAACGPLHAARACHASPSL